LDELPVANTKRKLLAAPQSKRYFLVPTDQRLERGAFVVYSLQGQRVDAKESDLAPFEVNAQAAKEFLTDQLGAFISNARRFGIEYMDQLKEWAAVEAEARDQPPPAPDLKHPFFEALRTIFAAGKSQRVKKPSAPTRGLAPSRKRRNGMARSRPRILRNSPTRWSNCSKNSIRKPSAAPAPSA